MSTGGRGPSPTGEGSRGRALSLDRADRTGSVRRPAVLRVPADFLRPESSSWRNLLSNHLNTRVKVDLSAKRGKVVVEFATLEDLERIYKLMVGRSESSVA